MPRSIGRSVVPPLHRPWDPDDSPDFHASRLLLLLAECGSQPGPHIAGRTKLAKLDFFLRYPAFLERAHEVLADTAHGGTVFRASMPEEVEAPMIRYRFGPWDPRYRQFLAFLGARDLVTITTSHKPERVRLTVRGKKTATVLAAMEEFQPIVARCHAMRGNLAEWSGTELKDLVYQLFPTEVADLAYHQEIRP
ncbi:hypothetical protein GCM10010495_77380 [Kitasatospora herbaricolor]|uniref:hypothetical protein n=1 Tax=Kitasatospora herbaricolor TaxID=68217 RepID=UPI00174C0C32|nr:hypothetical protein [Kitasatospora herbaricolor]MDQ0305817.1 hypothetical protein [Kitasatospora herbaricolor]GGV48088.1 hypothetical protein GCM10010495_77380 [Kitasatospora herbaricolor]